MGVWERSPAGTAIAIADKALVESFRQALPDLRPEDVVGSPYCIKNYEADPHLGARSGLAAARAALAEHGLSLILDFVPNHVAPDHPWTSEHPEYFVHGTEEDLERDPSSFLRVGDAVLANGRDPYFPAWHDVVQLNAFSPDLRAAAIETLESIAAQCDGVRCDMAMLMMNDTFERTWGERAGPRPDAEYWDGDPGRPPLPGRLRLRRGGVLGPRVGAPAAGFRLLLRQAPLRPARPRQRRGRSCAPDRRPRLPARAPALHREPRRAPAAAAALGPRARAAAVTALTQLGARLVHEGQLEGRRVRVPVQLARRTDEPVDTELRAFYDVLLGELTDPTFRDGEWELAERSGWEGNDTWRNLVAWWRRGDSLRLVVVNLGDVPASGHISLPRGGDWLLADALTGERYERSGDQLYVALEPWSSHLFTLSSSEA